MKTTAIIPSRMASTRLPGKPLLMISGKTLIQRVYESVSNTGLFNEIVIATDDENILKHCKDLNAKVIMTSTEHQSGTDRIYECLNKLDFETDLIINVQGDEPFITKAPLKDLISVFNDKSINIASLMYEIKDISEIQNPNNVKVITDSKGKAIYFSRSVIPYNRDNDSNLKYFKHIGVYAYTPEMLKTFVNLPKSNLESIEKLEQLRFIENGYPIRMVATDYKGIGIDTPEDLEKANMILKNIQE